MGRNSRNLGYTRIVRLRPEAASRGLPIFIAARKLHISGRLSLEKVMSEFKQGRVPQFIPPGSPTCRLGVFQTRASQA